MFKYLKTGKSTRFFIRKLPSNIKSYFNPQKSFSSLQTKPMEGEYPPLYIDPKTPILNVDAKDAFSRLTLQEKLYSYYFTRASWTGSLATYFQRSFESGALLYVLYKIFHAEDPETVKKNSIANGGLSDSEWHNLSVYISAFLNNCGNIRSFGDDKFIPQLPREKFEAFIHATKFYNQNKALVDELWNDISGIIYATQPPYNHIGFINEKRLSALYSANTTREDAALIDAFLQSINVQSWHSRVHKVSDNEFHILFASGKVGKANESKTHTLQGKTFKILYGDHAEILDKVADFLEHGKDHAANEIQKKMMAEYVDHFRTGSFEKHLNSQRLWVQDKGPIVETNIGFIETYVDPFGTRAEFEGFVAAVDKEQSKKYQRLVDSAEELLKFLPWGANFEKDTFLRPDFTSLEIITFSGAGTPRGINIPNYDEIRQTEGFKNVTLGNVMMKPKKELMIYTPEEYKDILVDQGQVAVNVKVALHELLGHGSGKLFIKEADGKFNFDVDKVINPLTNGPITKFYEHTETWGSKFGKINNAYEECRADTVALLLSTYDEVLKVLYPEVPEKWDDILFTVWYQVVTIGLQALEYWDAEKKAFGQAHMNADYVLVRVLLEAGEDLLKIVKEKKEDGADHFKIHLDRTKIRTVGRKAISNFAVKMQVYKSTGDVEAGSKMYLGYSEVDEFFLGLRDIVLKNRLPRRLELQGDLALKSGPDGKPIDVEYVSWPETFEGIITSYLYHYQNDIEGVINQWKAQREAFLLRTK